MLSESEEVYLCLKDGSKIFKGTFSKIVGGDTVHGRVLNEDEGRFFIVRILKDCSAWREFDTDIHCAGASVSWNLKHIVQSTAVQFSELTEARSPRLLQLQKQRKNPTKWEKKCEEAEVGDRIAEVMGAQMLKMHRF